MKNERRDTARVPIELEVMLNPDTQGYQLFRTRDVSLEGVFVELAGGASMPRSPRLDPIGESAAAPSGERGSRLDPVAGAPSRLVKNGKVTLAIKLTSDGRSHVHRVSARVVRVTPHGAGLAFDDVDSGTYAALLELVFAQLPKGSF
jgi:hypothetical protein